jgi:hypothetical protein
MLSRARDRVLLECWRFLVFGGLIGLLPGGEVLAQQVDFQRQVRPILAAKCFTCHGPDEAAREADLRLDRFEDAIADRGGAPAIRPGELEASEAWHRINSTDDDLRMPPPGPQAPLSPEQIAILARWIEQGAKYEDHWAFIPPKRAPVPLPVAADPAESAAVGPQSPIDAFINRSLTEAGLRPAPQADRYALVRRVYLDLIGIPPTPEQTDAFVEDSSPVAYERLVDTLLASPDYAARWARPWLDLARYADTNGYEKDRPRTIWPYRDWVLDAINQDLPYDQFSIRQLAGDTFENATSADRIATGFHRNTMLNEEGGIDPQEFRFHAMNDRVATTGTVWMGLTIGCAQCHTHKYDPITHHDYYSLYAFLNEADEVELEIADADVARRRQEIAAAIAKIENELIAQYLAQPHESELPWVAEPEPAPAAPPEAAQPEAAQPEAALPAVSPAAAEAPKPDPAKPDAAPAIPAPAVPQPPAKTPAELLAERQAAVSNEYAQFLRTLRDTSAAWQVVVPREMASTLPILRTLDDGSILASGDVTKREVFTLHFDPPAAGEEVSSYTALRLEALPDPSLPAGGPGMAFYEGRRGDFFLSEMVVTHNGQPLRLHRASASYGKISIGSGSADAANVLDGEGSTGWSTSGHEGQAERWVAQFEQPFRPDGSWSIEMTFERHFAAPLGRFRFSLAAEPTAPSDEEPAAPMVAAQPHGPEQEAAFYRWKRDPAQVPDDAVLDAVRRTFIARSETLAELRKPIEALRNQMPESVRTLVMLPRDRDQQRVTSIYHRGEYLHPREPVTASIPQLFVPLSERPPKNRAEFARWLVSPANPLFARVTVDRAWRELFGRGIVDTAGDYGTQSEPPSHPELLDYLATEFVSDEMSMKRLHRQIVLSDAYRRDSRVVEAARDVDPNNRLLATGPRRRLEAERVRDSLLAASGLLTHAWGGPSVFPPQPESVTASAYGRTPWNASTGGDRYRRSLYTYAKRTAPFAAFGVFDGPTGESCIPRRDVSNSPLQALTLLNDAMFQDMAAALADDVLRRRPDAAPEVIVNDLFRRLMTRPPTDQESAAILAFHAGLNPVNAADPAAAPEAADAAPPEGPAEAADPVDPRAAWVLVARALMNSDEAITTP